MKLEFIKSVILGFFFLTVVETRGTCKGYYSKYIPGLIIYKRLFLCGTTEGTIGSTLWDAVVRDHGETIEHFAFSLSLVLMTFFAVFGLAVLIFGGNWITILCSLLLTSLIVLFVVCKDQIN